MKKTKELTSRKLIVKSLGVATLLTFTIFLSTVSAQESINATGGNASGSGGSASYSVGQVVYKTHTGTNETVAEGVQQPYEISLVATIEEAKGINLVVSAFPNPTIDDLTLEVKNFDLSSLYYKLYDMQGTLLQSKKIADGQTNIAMSNLAPGTYLVKVLHNSKEVKTFKIVKR